MAARRTTDPYYLLYPALNATNTGQYSAWAWGVSRIIDGLELVQNVLPIDLKHMCVTGCSYAGKMALFAGAFDERIALTIAQESGGGGATSWRYSQSEPTGTVEKVDNTDYNWFMDAMKQFSGNNVSRLPEDHHELMAMCAPRALYVYGKPGLHMAVQSVVLRLQQCLPAGLCRSRHRRQVRLFRYGWTYTLSGSGQPDAGNRSLRGQVPAWEGYHEYEQHRG